MESDNQTIFDILGDEATFDFHELRNEELQDLIAVFSFQALSDYRSNPAFPPLTPPMLKKLKQLTLLTLAKEQRALKYSHLMPLLEFNTVRDLEDFMINCINLDILVGAFDQKNSVFLVETCISRQIEAPQLEGLKVVLSAWREKCNNLVSQIEVQILYKEDENRLKEQSDESYKAALDLATSKLDKKGKRAFDGNRKVDTRGFDRDRLASNRR